MAENKSATKQIIYRRLTDLKKLPHNPRTIKNADFEKLKKSLSSNLDYFEARPLILSNRTGHLVIIAGNQRYEAAKALGMAEAPTVLLEGLTEEREREIIIRDNVSNGDWDMDALANEWDIDDLQDWGVDIKPLKVIAEDEPAPVDKENTFSVVGEIYQLGDNRMFCGSFEDDEKVRELFGGDKATCTFTDPPYNVAYKSADGKSIQNDKKSEEDFRYFLNRAFKTVAQNTVSGGGVISWMSEKELFTLFEAMKNNGLEMKQVITWVKNTFTLGRTDFQNQMEPAIYSLNEGRYNAECKDGESDTALYTRSGGYFAPTRKLSNCWFFEKPKANKDHPTMKPIGLCAKGILALSEPGDIVFDPFLGSGSTLIAAEQTGRKCFGCEIDPKYCDVIRKRWWEFTTGSEGGWQNGTKSIA